MIRKLAILLVIPVLFSISLHGQQSLAFQQLRNATFQSTNYNPAWMPKGVVFLGLPVLSDVGFYVNNRFSYNDLITDNENGGKLINITNAISKLGINNVVSANVNLGLFHFGVRTPSGHSFALFANERIEADLTYPKNLAKWAWEGNATFIGRKLSFSSLGLTANYFREYGLAYAVDDPEHGVKLGIRVKYYQGLINASTPASLAINFQTENENFQVNLDNKNVVVRTAGIEEIQNGGNPVGYLLFNGNRGFGIDLGLEKRINRYYTLGLAITDIGYISWKTGIKNYAVADTSMRYVGVNLKGVEGLLQTIQDSLFGRFGIDENSDAYRTLAVARVNGHLIYSPFPYLDVITSASGKVVQGQPKIGVGVGVRGHLGPKLIASANVNRLPQQFFNIGAALAVNPGPVQLYIAADKLVGYSVPNMRWAEAKIGINFVFGSKTRYKQAKIKAAQIEEERVITEPKGVVSGTFMGRKVSVKRSEGLYTFIRKQPRPEARTITPEVDNGAHQKKSIQSASGQNRSYYQKKQIRSATGRAYKSDYKRKKIGSTAPTQSRGSYKKQKVKVRSASGAHQRFSGKQKKTKIRTASGLHRGAD